MEWVWIALACAALVLGLLIVLRGNAFTISYRVEARSVTQTGSDITTVFEASSASVFNESQAYTFGQASQRLHDAFMSGQASLGAGQPEPQQQPDTD